MLKDDKVHAFMVNYLIKHGHYPKQQTLAERFKVSRQAINHMTERLIAKGLLAVSKHKGTKRRVDYSFDYRGVILDNVEEVKKQLE